MPYTQTTFGCRKLQHSKAASVLADCAANSLRRELSYVLLANRVNPSHWKADGPKRDTVHDVLEKQAGTCLPSMSASFTSSMTAAWLLASPPPKKSPGFRHLTATSLPCHFPKYTCPMRN